MNCQNLGLVFQKLQLQNQGNLNLYDELKSRGVEVVKLDYSIHGDNKVNCSENVKIAGAVRSISFVRNSKSLFEGIAVGTLFTNELHYYSRYQSKIDFDKKINRNALMLPFSEIKERGISNLLKNLNSEDDRLFIKPDQSLKICEAEVVSKESWATWCEYTTNHTGVSENSLMWFSEAKDIKREYRCLVLNGEVLSASSYGFNKSPKNEDNNKSLFNFANDIASKIELDDPAYILDIAELMDGSYCFIELNCLSTSGVYSLTTSALADAWISSLKSIYRYSYDF